jgi:hypothetical protein
MCTKIDQFPNEILNVFAPNFEDIKFQAIFFFFFFFSVRSCLEELFSKEYYSSKVL